MRRSSIPRAGLFAGLLTASLAVVAYGGTASSAGTATSGSSQTSTSSSTTGGTGASQGSQKAAPQGSQQAAPPGVAAVLVLLPVQQANDPNMAKGCWVRFHDHKNFKGDTLTLVGPVDMVNMDPPGPAWQDWDSAVVGPKARVTTFDNENFRDRSATLSPGQQIADLNDSKLGWFEEIKSARVSCS